MSDLILIKPDESLDVLKGFCCDIPTLSYQSEMVYIEMQGEIKATEKTLENIKNNFMLLVCRALDKRSGKLKFPNQVLREAEVGRLLKEHEEYTDLSKKLVEFFTARDKAKARVHYLDKMFSVVKNLAWNGMELDRLKQVREMKVAEGKVFK